MEPNCTYYLPFIAHISADRSASATPAKAMFKVTSENHLFVSIPSSGRKGKEVNEPLCRLTGVVWQYKFVLKIGYRPHQFFSSDSLP